MVVWLLRLSGRALAVQARGVLGSTPGNCWPFHFLLQHLIKFLICSVRQDALSILWFYPCRVTYIEPLLQSCNNDVLFSPPLVHSVGEGGSEDLKEEAAQVEPAYRGSVEAAGGPTRRGGDARCDRSGPQTACSSQGGGAKGRKERGRVGEEEGGTRCTRFWRFFF